MKPFFFLFFLALLPATAAFNCAYFINQTDCQAALTVNEDLIANLIYTNTSHPDHAAIASYNAKIVVNDTPAGYTKYQQGTIRDAWVALLTLQPSITINTTQYCPANFTARSEASYWIKVPDDYYNNAQSDGATCKILHYLNENTSSLTTTANNRLQGLGKNVTIKSLAEDATIQETLSIRSTIKNDYYTWQRYCCSWGRRGCRRYCYRCPQTSTTYTTDTLSINDSTRTSYFGHTPNVSFTLIASYAGTTKAILMHDQNTSLWLHLGQSNYTSQVYEYEANFMKKPFDLLELRANPVDISAWQNLLRNNGTFYVANISNCSLHTEDPFTSSTTPCQENLSETPSAVFAPPTTTIDWIFILKLAVFAALMVGFYRISKKYLQKFAGFFIVLLLLLPSVRAEDCGLTNLASCLPQAIFDFLLGIINAPLEPLLNFVKTLLESSPSIDLFQGVWAIIVYCLSMFYGFLFLYAGYQFLTSGHNVLKRELAKEWLKNTVIMIVLIQASYYLYGLVVDMGSIMTQAVLSLVDNHFFLITADNIINIALEFLLVGAYVIVLLFTVFLLVIRYLVVALGVLFAPIGIFCYFLPPLRSYGKLILNLLGLCIFVTFLEAIIILACSKLIALPIFENYKIIVMITCFLIVDIVFIILGKHAIAKSGLSDGAESISQAAKYIAMLG